MEQKVQTVGSHRGHKVRDLDFRRPIKFTRDQLRVIERSQDGFCRSASSRLSAELRSEVTVAFSGSEQLVYGAVMAEEMPQQALVLIMKTEPPDTRMVMVVQNETASSLVARSLGGAVTESGEGQELTELETAVARRALAGLIDEMSVAWQDLCGVSLKVAATETSPIAVQVASPSEPTLILTFSLQFEEHSSSMALIVPWSALEAVIDGISHSHSDASVAGPATAKAVGRAEVQLRAEAGSKQMAVSDLLALSEGDVLSFPQSETEGIDLLVEDQPLYKARHGSHNGQRAVQVGDMIDPSQQL